MSLILETYYYYYYYYEKFHYALRS